MKNSQYIRKQKNGPAVPRTHVAVDLLDTTASLTAFFTAVLWAIFKATSIPQILLTVPVAIAVYLIAKIIIRIYARWEATR